MEASLSAYSLLDRARRHGTPLIEESRAIFVWEGETPPRLMADFNGWEDGAPDEFEWVDENLWAFGIELPEDAYIEYAFSKDGVRISDPYNRRKTPNGLGKTNHYFYMSKGKSTSLTHPVTADRRGEISEATLVSDWYFANGHRKVYFYQPQVEQPVPLVVVWDGKDYLGRAHLPNIVDNLIALGKIQPVALAMIDNGGPARGVEYMCSDATPWMLVEALIPEARKRLNLIDYNEKPGSYGVMGASAGGLIALYTGLRLPHIFGNVLAQSGAYSFGPFDTVVWDLVDRMDPSRLNLWLDAGKFEWLVDCNRRMAGYLAERAFHFQYHEYNGGHNYPAWRNDLAAGLEFLF
jgi:enterochelin esterase-like enzyme